MYARAFLGGVLFAFSGVCLAQFANVPPVVSSGLAGGSVSYGGGLPSAFQRQITSAPNSAARIIDNIRLSLPANAVAEVAAGRIITKAALSVGVSIAVGTGVGAVAVAAAPMLWDYMKSQGYLPGGMVDPGQAKTAQGGLMHDFRTGQPMSPSAIAARESALYCSNQTAGSGVLTCSVTQSTGGCNAGQCTYAWAATVRYTASGGVAWTGGGNDSGNEITAVICPQTSLAPVVVAYGGAACPSDSRVPATEAQKQAAIDAMPAEVVPKVAEELLDKVPLKTESPTLSGPASVTAPPKVTTKPDGTVQTETKTHNLTYNGDTYNFTTNTVNVAGDTTTTIENDLPPEQPKTDCEKNPGAVGCLEVGEAQDPGMKKHDITVSVTPTGGWGSEAGACPSARQVDVLGQVVTIDNSVLCQFLSGIRFAVVGAFGLVAVMVFVGGLRQ